MKYSNRRYLFIKTNASHRFKDYKRINMEKKMAVGNIDAVDNSTVE